MVYTLDRATGEFLCATGGDAERDQRHRRGDRQRHRERRGRLSVKGQDVLACPTWFGGKDWDRALACGRRFGPCRFVELFGRRPPPPAGAAPGETQGDASAPLSRRLRAGWRVDHLALPRRGRCIAKTLCRRQFGVVGPYAVRFVSATISGDKASPKVVIAQRNLPGPLSSYGEHRAGRVPVDVVVLPDPHAADRLRSR